MISTHALREEGDRRCNKVIGQVRISTHALREEGDYNNYGSSTRFHIFLPTPSARRATRFGNAAQIAALISTHALREEGDAACPRLS